eukprot:TRINITY_DN1665_c0_g1_i5.p1 TRINITY_DN1665_c0_g1~~TRINITY_DN1665_c0_g1_i5.p1  ORF type:complete len:1027 (+),score=365.08 TRINITY_DN1665_c0_g1_i5:336-3083(+)
MKLEPIKFEHMFMSVSDPKDVNSDSMKRKRNADVYIQFLREKRLEQEKKLQIAAMDELNNSTDIGMEPGCGLISPRLEMMKETTEELLQGTQANPTGNDSLALQKQHMEEAAEKSTFRKKFKPKPASNEVKACKNPLTKAELFQCVTSGNKKIDFGKVPLNSVIGRAFHFTNILPNPVLVTMTNPGDLSEIEFNPDSMVIPPMSTGSFDVNFHSPIAQNFSRVISYTINGVHTYSITLIAEAIPITLTASPVQISMTFHPERNKSWVSECVILSNTFSQDAKFSATVPLPFVVEPSTGVVPANGQLDLEVKFFPDSRTDVDERIRFRVENGTDTILSVRGEVYPTNLSFTAKKVDFYLMSVGQCKSIPIKLKNSGTNPAFFQFDPAKGSSAGISMEPIEGCVHPDCTQDAVITCSPSSPQSIETYIRVNVPGGKPLRLFVKGQADFPSVTLKQEEFNFGDVFIGGQARRVVMLENSGTIPAILELDLGPLRKEFTVVPPQAIGGPSGRGAGRGQIAVESDCEMISVTQTAKKEEEVEKIAPLSSSSGTLGKSPSDTPRTSGSQQQADEEREIWRIRINGGASLKFDLVFSPTVIAHYEFVLPLNIVGQSETSSLNRTVRANAIVPPVTLSEREIAFGTKVVLKDASQPYSSALFLTNDTDHPLTWEIDISAPSIQKGIFQLQPKMGSLAIGEKSSIRASFIPLTVGHYSAEVPVLVSSANQTTPLQFSITGEGSFPKMAFDVDSVVLPVVPLNITSTMIFNIINLGYDDAEVSVKLPTDRAHAPFNVKFLEGSHFRSSVIKLPVEISWSSARPFSFSAKMEFTDGIGGKFPIFVSGVSDNSLFTVAPYLALHKGRYEISGGRKGKPITLIEADVSEEKDGKEKEKEKEKKKGKKGKSKQEKEKQGNNSERRRTRE